jgi:predicted metalloprotease with PDZ domain
LWLDGTIRKESGGSKSLNDDMFDLIQQSNQPYTLARILAAADRYLSPTSQALLQNAVSRHGELPAPAELPVLGKCAHAELGDFPSFDLGFDFDKSAATKIVSGVTDNGPAFNAGMRNGQALLTSSFSKHHPDRLANFTIRAETGNKRITFYPRGAPVQAWQYRLDQTQSCGGIASTAQGLR